MQVGAGPPFQNPPLVGDVGGAFGASLRAWMQGRAIPGRRTQTPGRSPCFRTFPGLLSSWCRQAWGAEMGSDAPTPDLVESRGVRIRATEAELSGTMAVPPAASGVVVFAHGT